MANRKVLLATYYFPPCAAVAVHRMIGLARHLPRFGWDPIVVAPPRAPFELEEPALLDAVPPETAVVRTPFPKGLTAKVRELIYPMSSWLPAAHAACREVVARHRPDAIMTSSPPGCIHRLGLKLKAETNLPWAVCLRDPWVTNGLAERRYGFVRRQLELRAESRTFAAADLIIANTPKNRDGFANVYPQWARKMIVAPNGYDPETFAELPPHRPSPGRITLVHAGELYVGRDPRLLLDALADLRNNPVPGLPPIGMNFFGRATEGVFDLDEEIRRRQLQDRVQNLGQITYRQALGELVAADVLVLVHTPNYRLGVPAKLYEYLGARRPILALAEPESDVGWVLRTSGVAHRIASPTDGPGIRAALVELAQQHVRDDAPAPREDGLFQFTREGMASRVAQGLDWATSRGSQPDAKADLLVHAGDVP